MLSNSCIQLSFYTVLDTAFASAPMGLMAHVSEQSLFTSVTQGSASTRKVLSRSTSSWFLQCTQNRGEVAQRVLGTMKMVLRTEKHLIYEEKIKKREEMCSEYEQTTSSALHWKMTDTRQREPEHAQHPVRH